eukprot:SM000049S16775  [mRNA]  locus=s49:639324:643077:+ [translate_table: standard]
MTPPGTAPLGLAAPPCTPPLLASPAFTPARVARPSLGPASCSLRWSPAASATGAGEFLLEEACRPERQPFAAVVAMAHGADSMDDGGAVKEYPGVVVGGTFDHLHEGHKLLISKALQLVEDGGVFVVGISTGRLLSKKKLKELIEPYEMRRNAVEEYVKQCTQTMGKRVELDVLPITEAAPERAVSNAQVQCIIVSPDTRAGAEAFNKARQMKGMSSVDVVVIDLVIDKEGPQSEQLSSTLLRQRLLGTFLPRPAAQQSVRLSRDALSTWPYLVGLTGGMASGKSAVRQELQVLGAEVLDCDVLGHKSYQPGTPTYYALVQAFGPGILQEDNTVDRQALGAIVFEDQQQMSRLTSIVWPAIGQLLMEQCEEAAVRGCRLCIAEAPVLLEAGWQSLVDEVWVVIASEAVARGRLMKRNGITEQDAHKRLDSQMRTEERVMEADVVIDNNETLEATREQVQRAWLLLQERLTPLQSSWSGLQSRDPLFCRWAGLMRRLSVKKEVAEEWWQFIEAHYRQHNRHYHTFTHLQSLYTLYGRYAHFVADPCAFHLAIFFHDVVYEPRASVHGVNEKESAALFFRFARAAELTSNLEEKVNKYILQTINHLEDIQVSKDLALFLDLDLAILGAAKNDYEMYAANIRREYMHMEEAVYREKRANLLQVWLARSRLYRTEIVHQAFGDQAKINLTWELAGLRDTSSSLDTFLNLLEGV